MPVIVRTALQSRRKKVIACCDVGRTIHLYYTKVRNIACVRASVPGSWCHIPPRSLALPNMTSSTIEVEIDRLYNLGAVLL